MLLELPNQGSTGRRLHRTDDDLGQRALYESCAAENGRNSSKSPQRRALGPGLVFVAV